MIERAAYPGQNIGPIQPRLFRAKHRPSFRKGCKTNPHIAAKIGVAHRSAIAKFYGTWHKARLQNSVGINRSVTLGGSSDIANEAAIRRFESLTHDRKPPPRCAQPLHLHIASPRLHRIVNILDPNDPPVGTSFYGGSNADRAVCHSDILLPQRRALWLLIQPDQVLDGYVA